MAEAPILVVDDEEEVLQVIQEYLKESGYSVVIARDLSEALAKISSDELQTVISDLLLGADRLGGIEVLRESAKKSIPCILISGNANLEALKEAINLGASHFLDKPFELADLLTIIKKTKAKPQAIQDKSEQLIQSSGLTHRESEIFHLIAKGLSNRDIAEATGTSERTVKAHISSIFRKLEVSSRAELLSKLIV